MPERGLKPSSSAAPSQIRDQRPLTHDSFLATIIESSDDAIISTSRDGVIATWNKSAEQLYGYTAEEALGQPIMLVIPADLRDEELRIFDRVRCGERIEHYETVRLQKDGKTVDISLTISPIRSAAGQIVGVSKVARDITQRKQAEEIMSTLSQRLIEAQEQERARIARELHDHINQRIALAVLSLENLKKESTPLARDGIEQVETQLRELATDVQSLSHELHSPKLEQLGLSKAAKSFCREFSEQHKVKIDFQSENVPENLPTDIGIGLFRILQEALHNAAKHSGSREFKVSLASKTNGLQLTVRDSGKGFDAQKATKAQGIGLLSMKERLKLLNGELTIQSEPSHGTTISARVPLKPIAKSAGAG